MVEPNGRTQPSYENMDRLCEALDCSIADLLENEPIQHKLDLREIV